jgi:hypothetical protein
MEPCRPGPLPLNNDEEFCKRPEEATEYTADVIAA